MAEATCSIRKCETKPLARGLCSRHYQKARSSGTLPPVQMMLPLKPVHSMSNVDKENRVGDCQVCGPGVPVRIRPPRGPECGRKKRRGVIPPELKKRAKRKDRLWTLYRMTPEQHDAMLSEQGGLCAICQDRPPKLYIDHDHVTGEVRGLLCNRCNVALGCLRDSREAAIAAAMYLDR